MEVQMTRSEIIETTLAELRRANASCQETADTERSSAIGNDEVISTLMERLPDDVDIKTCADVTRVEVTCCDICHTFLPHYDMEVEALPDGSVAWLCCSVRSALRGDDRDNRTSEVLDFERALNEGLEGSTSDD
jgi:hypothetical protein